MAEFDTELEEIAQLIRLVEARGLTELIVEEEGRRIVIRGADYVPHRLLAAPAAAPSAESPVSPALAPAPLVPAGGAGAPPVENRIAVPSPMVGVFYHAAGPDSLPFVEAGDHVEVGQPIGMIEAMKVFSEIPSDHAGVVQEIVARNGQLVRQGEPLLYLKAG